MENVNNMTKSELRRARKAAKAASQPLTGELAVHSGHPSFTIKRTFKRSRRNRFGHEKNNMHDTSIVGLQIGTTDKRQP